MSDKESHIESSKESEKTIKKLTKLKKKMVKRVVNKMAENNGDIMLLFGKKYVIDYLIDEGGEDRFDDFFLGLGIDFLTGYGKSLEKLREDINSVQSKKELDDLEKSIIERMSASTDDEQQSSTKQDETTTSVSGSTVSHSTENHSVVDNNSDGNLRESIDSAPIGEAADIPLEQRMAWLFPGGVPQTEKQMKKYITKIKVPVRTAEGKTKKLTLHVHKKLSKEFKAIFQEMYDSNIPVNPDATACYNRRKMRNGSKMSHHSFGTAIDVNRTDNGGVYGKTNENSPYYNDQATVNIWEKHGFYRGGDWSRKANDPMHFTYMNG